MFSKHLKSVKISSSLKNFIVYWGDNPHINHDEGVCTCLGFRGGPIDYKGRDEKGEGLSGKPIFVQLVFCYVIIVECLS